MVDRMPALRHKRPLASSKSNFRFTLESGLNLNIGACPESANNGSALAKFVSTAARRSTMRSARGSHLKGDRTAKR